MDVDMTHSDIGEVLSSLQNSIRLQAALMAKLEQRDRQTADRPSTPGRVNLMNWDGNGSAEGLFPPVTGAVRKTEKRKDSS